MLQNPMMSKDTPKGTSGTGVAHPATPERVCTHSPASSSPHTQHGSKLRASNPFNVQAGTCFWGKIELGNWVRPLLAWTLRLIADC